MQFTHRDAAGRTATVEQSPDAASTWVVRHQDASGKARKKSFKNGFTAALRFVLNKEGFILRAPQPGPVKWMTRLLQPYYGEIGHDVDPTTGAVWVVDSEDHVHRVTPGSCEIVSARLGTGTQSPGWQVAAGAGGSAWVLATSWRKEDGGLVRVAWLYRVTPSGEALAVHELARFDDATPVMALSATRDGRCLGPHARGMALYGADGGVLRVWDVPAPDPLPNPTYRAQPAHAALSASGEWLAVGAPPAVRVVHLVDGAERDVPADMKDLSALQVTDAGVAYASGFAYPYHALFRLDPGGLVRVSTDTRATVSADGLRVAEAEASRVTLRDLAAPIDDPESFDLFAPIASASLPVLGMAKYGRCRFGPDGELAVLTDAYTIAAVRL